MKVSVNPYLPEFENVRRSWHERLFSLPWKPWRKTKRVRCNVAYVVGDVAYVRPDQLVAFQKQLRGE